MYIPNISVTVFTILILLTMKSFINRKNIKLLGGLIIAYMFFWLFIFIENKFGFHIYDIALLLVAITIFLHFFIGENLRFYYNKGYFDRGLHFFGTIAFTLFAYLIMIETLKPALNSNILIFIFILSLGTLLGVIFELIEFVIDLIFKTRSQKGLIDTNFDLIFDLIGAIFTGLMVLYYRGIYF